MIIKKISHRQNISKYDDEIVETVKIDTRNTHNRFLSCFGSGTSGERM
jgi:hypothetical protein